MSEEITFVNLRNQMQNIINEAGGYIYPAPHTRVFMFGTSRTRQTLQAIADATELNVEVNANFPNKPQYDIQLLDGPSGMFQTLVGAIRRAPRYVETEGTE